jgi:hypothetical protein
MSSYLNALLEISVQLYHNPGERLRKETELHTQHNVLLCDCSAPTGWTSGLGRDITKSDIWRLYSKLSVERGLRRSDMNPALSADLKDCIITVQFTEPFNFVVSSH